MNPILLAAATVGDKIDPLFRNFDMWVYQIFGSIQNDVLTAIAKVFTALGDENFVIPVAVLGVVLCFFKRTRKYGFALIFAIAIGTLVTNVVVKPAFLRIRPYNTLQTLPKLWKDYSVWYKAAGSLSESDYSFPSGHTTAAFEMAVAMFLAFRSTAREQKNEPEGGSTVMGKIAFLLPIIALLTMASRVYLMVHYPTDVIAGLIVGSVAGLLGFLLSKGVCALFEKTPLDKIDLERVFKKGIGNKAAGLCVFIILIGFFCLSYVPAMSEGGDSAVRCSYGKDDGCAYDCNNEARGVDEDDIKKGKYLGEDIDGDGDVDHFCKMHWKELKEKGVITGEGEAESK